MVSSMTIKEFAAEVGVSPATVSRALNGHRDVSEETRRLVQRRMVELGYHPNRAASALSSRRSGLVAVWSGNELAPYHVKVIDALRRVAARDECQIIIEYDSTAGGPAPRLTPGWPVDGVVVLGTHAFEQRGGTVPADLPIVGIDDHILEGVDTVGPNLRVGAREALAHLWSEGCRRIALLVPRWVARESDSRWLAYLDAMREFGCGPLVFEADTHDASAGRDGVLRGLARHGLPDGVFCYNDDLALGALSALHAAGVNVPDEVAVVGCDGQDKAAFWHPALTTIMFPYGELATLAWECLRRRLDDPAAAPRQLLVQPTLVVRQSSRRRTPDGAAQDSSPTYQGELP